VCRRAPWRAFRPAPKKLYNPTPRNRCNDASRGMTCGFKKRGGRPRLPVGARAGHHRVGPAAPGVVLASGCGRRARSAARESFAALLFRSAQPPIVDASFLGWGHLSPEWPAIRHFRCAVRAGHSFVVCFALPVGARLLYCFGGRRANCGQQGIPDALQDHKDWSGERPGCGGAGVFWARPTDCFRRVCCCCNLPPLPAWASQHAACVPCVSFAGRRGSMVCGGLGMGAGAARSYLGITHTCPLAILFLRPCAGLRALTRCNPPAAACAGVPNLAREGCMRTYRWVRCRSCNGRLVAVTATWVLQRPSLLTAHT